MAPFYVGMSRIELLFKAHFMTYFKKKTYCDFVQMECSTISRIQLLRNRCCNRSCGSQNNLGDALFVKILWFNDLYVIFEDGKVDKHNVRINTTKTFKETCQIAMNCGQVIVRLATSVI